MYVSIYLSIYLPTYLPSYLSIYLSIYLCAYLCLYACMYMFVDDVRMRMYEFAQRVATPVRTRPCRLLVQYECDNSRQGKLTKSHHVKGA